MLSRSYGGRVCGLFCSLCLAGSDPFTTSTMPGPQESHTGRNSGASKPRNRQMSQTQLTPARHTHLGLDLVCYIPRLATTVGGAPTRTGTTRNTGRILQTNSLARHYTRDWRALASISSRTSATRCTHRRDIIVHSFSFPWDSPASRSRTESKTRPGVCAVCSWRACLHE